MKSQPNRNYKSNDAIMTPQWLADAVVDAVQPSGVLLEPCAGAGAFVRAMSKFGSVRICEVGENFFFWSEPVDWIITNPPWSDFRRFLSHSLALSNNVVFLATVNHWWTRRRVSDVLGSGFGYRTLLLTPWPVEFPASGFQLGAMHIERGWTGPLTISNVVDAARRSAA